jgi:hypothetical protein
LKLAEGGELSCEVAEVPILHNQLLLKFIALLLTGYLNRF